MKNTVEFGRYLMKEGELREIEWIVLNETPDGKKLLISKDCIEAMQYEYSENKNAHPKWENCVVYHDKRGFFIALFIRVWYTYLDKSGLKKV